MTQAISSAARFYAIRLVPGTDVLTAVQDFVREKRSQRGGYRDRGR